MYLIEYFNIKFSYEFIILLFKKSILYYLPVLLFGSTLLRIYPYILNRYKFSKISFLFNFFRHIYEFNYIYMGPNADALEKWIRCVKNKMKPDNFDNVNGLCIIYRIKRLLLFDKSAIN